MARVTIVRTELVIEMDVPVPEQVHTNARPETAAEQSSSPVEETLYANRNSAALTPDGLQTPAEAYTPLGSSPDTSSTSSSLSASPSDLAALKRKHDKSQAPLIPSFMNPYMNRWRVLAACLIYLGNGMNDSATGALLPSMEAHYEVGYAVISTIFVTNAIGFILAAFCTDIIRERIGRARTLMLSETAMTLGYIITACVPPFPVVVGAYLLIGYGCALNLALNNVFCANLAKSTIILGAAHGAFGIGGVVGPIIATTLVSNGYSWSRFYLILIGVRVLCFFVAGWSFWNYENEGTTQFSNSLHRIAGQQASEEVGDSRKLRLLLLALRNTTTIMGALFIFAYGGGEVAESGWFISYLIKYRHGDPTKVGYVTSGFWAGITLGRFILTHATRYVGEKRFVFVLGVGTIGFQCACWFIPNVIGDAVAVSIVGFLLGPIYPCAQTMFTRLLPANIQMIAIGFISSAGSSGGAIVPLVTGLLAQATGTYVLHPVCIGFFLLMLGCWTCLPRPVEVEEEMV